MAIASAPSRVSQLLDEGRGYGTLVQIAAARLGGTGRLSLAVAEGASGDPRSLLLPLWCAGKPILGMYVVELLRTEGLDLDWNVLPSVLPTELADRIGPLSVADLLDHQKGLPTPAGLASVITPPESIRSDVRSSLRSATLAEPQYSEVAAGLIMCLGLRSKLGRVRLGDDLNAKLAGLTEHMILPSPSRASLERLATMTVASFVQPVRAEAGIGWLPLLSESEVRRLVVRPETIGMCGSAAALCQWYRCLGRHLLGIEEMTAGLMPPAKMLGDPRDADGRLTSNGGRPIAFWNGLMMGPDSLGLPGLDRSIVGHLGWTGSSVGLIDLANDLAIAVIVNGLVDMMPGFLPWRHEMVQGLYEALT